MSRVLLCPGPHQVLPNPPAFPLRSGGFLVCARSLSESGRVAASLMPRVRHRSEAVDIDHGQLVYPSLNRFAIVMDLHEHGVSRWAGHEQVKVEAARAVRQDGSGSCGSALVP